MKKIDLIKQHCQANNEKFLPDCQYYERNAEECRLLKTGQLAAFFEQGRCRPQNMIAAAVRGNLQGRRDLFKRKEYQQDVENDRLTDNLAFQARQEISKTLQERALQEPKLSYFKAYINETTYHIVVHWLQDEGFLSSGKCADCIHLSKIEDEPICQRETILEENDKAGKMVSLEIPNPEYGRKKIPSRDSCKKGFAPYQFESDNTTNKIRGYNRAELPNLLAVECESYLRRQANMTQGKERQKWLGYHTEFVRFKQLIGGFVLTKTALAALKKQGVSEEMIKRLTTLHDQEFPNEHMFIAAVKQLLGKDVMQNSQNPLRNQIVNAARLTRQQVFERISKIRGMSAETVKDHWNEIKKILREAGIFSNAASETDPDSSRYEEGGDI